MTPSTAAIEFHNVTKFFRHVFSGDRVRALSDVSFQANAGEVCAFLGPNGAGKTTSISILMGFLFSDSGEVRVLGYPPGDVRAKQQIGFLPENFAFYRHLTGPNLLRLHLTLSGRKVERPDDWIGELMAKVRLAGYEDLRIGRYSRGMVQRLGLAQALLGDPQLLVLDEPTSGLDPAGRKEVLDLLHALKSAGKTVFLSSHILPEVEQICDRVVIIDHGRLLQSGRLAELLASGNRVAIVVDRLPEDLAQSLRDRGASLSAVEQGMIIVIDAALKREAIECLWTAGVEVIRLNPMKSSLEDMFLKTVQGGHESA